MKLNNKYYVMRHGRALSNKKDIVICWPERGRFPLTSEGREQVRESREQLVDKKIDLIFASDLLRTKQTAELVGQRLKIKPKYDKRLREYNMGVLNGKPTHELVDYFKDQLERFKKKPKNGETYADIIKRLSAFLKEIDKKYKDKNILIVTHQVPAIMLIAIADNLSRRKTFEKFLKLDKIKTAEIRKLN